MTVSQGPLKDYLNARKSPTKVASRIETHLLSRKPDTSRRTDVLHPSEIVSDEWCLRASYFLLTGHEMVRHNHPLRLESIFQTGHDTHDKWQSWAAQAGILFGDYKCQSCGTVVQDILGLPTFLCHGCGWKTWKYAEISVEIPEFRISGHTDGWLSLDDGDYLWEIKSVGTGTIRHSDPSLMRPSLSASFKEIRRPFRDHQRQIQLYMAGLQVDQAIVTYECKENQEYKEFVLKRNPSLIADVFDRAGWLMEQIERGDEPECSINPGGGSCKKCKEFS